MKRITGLLALCLLGGCNTPSVPLPPPDLPALTILTAGTGLVSVQGRPDPRHARVRFYIFDEGAGDGVITPAAADGSFTSSPFAGMSGDTVQMYYDTPEGDRSEDVCTMLQINVGLISTACP
jgi:hypothetical protein